MIVVAFLAGVAIGAGSTTAILGIRHAKQQRDRRAVSQHMALVRAMSTLSTPRADRR